jgi:hypothetical protein
MVHTAEVKIGYSPAPGHSRTTVVVWQTDDPGKAGDGRYWWLPEDVELLRKRAPEMPDFRGRPRGESLASLRRRSQDGEVDLTLPPLPGQPDQTPVRLPLDQWRDADPNRTYFIVSHQRRPTDEEQEEREAEGFPWPGHAEAYRQQWLSAEALGDEVRAAEARRRFDVVLAELGFRKARDLSPWNPDRATELAPGVYVQDERPFTPS